MRILMLLAFSSLLNATSFTSVSVTSIDCPEVSAQSTTGETISVEAACFSDRIGAIGSNGYAEAGSSFVEVGMHSVNGMAFPLLASASVTNTDTAILPGEGFALATLTFEVTGEVATDGLYVFRNFNFNAGGVPEQFDIITYQHYYEVNQQFTTKPFQVALGKPFEYSTELTAWIEYNYGGFASASADFNLSLVGVDNVGSVAETPEPSTILLVGTGLVLLHSCKYERKRRRARRDRNRGVDSKLSHVC